MKRLIVLCLLLFALISCSETNNTYNLTGVGAGANFNGNLNNAPNTGNNTPLVILPPVSPEPGGTT